MPRNPTPAQRAASAANLKAARAKRKARGKGGKKLARGITGGLNEQVSAIASKVNSAKYAKIPGYGQPRRGVSGKIYPAVQRKKR